MTALSSKGIERFTSLRRVYWGCAIGCVALNTGASPVERTLTVTTGAAPGEDTVLIDREWLESATDEEFVLVLHNQHLQRTARVENWLAAELRSSAQDVRSDVFAQL